MRDQVEWSREGKLGSELEGIVDALGSAKPPHYKACLCAVLNISCYSSD